MVADHHDLRPMTLPSADDIDWLSGAASGGWPGLSWVISGIAQSLVPEPAVIAIRQGSTAFPNHKTDWRPVEHRLVRSDSMHGLSSALGAARLGLLAGVDSAFLEQAEPSSPRTGQVVLAETDLAGEALDQLRRLRYRAADPFGQALGPARLGLHPSRRGHKEASITLAAIAEATLARVREGRRWQTLIS